MPPKLNFEESTSDQRAAMAKIVDGRLAETARAFEMFGWIEGVKGLADSRICGVLEADLSNTKTPYQSSLGRTCFQSSRGFS